MCVCVCFPNTFRDSRVPNCRKLGKIKGHEEQLGGRGGGGEGEEEGEADASKMVYIRNEVQIRQESQVGQVCE